GASGDEKKIAWIKWYNILASYDKEGDVPLYSRFNRLFNLDRNKDCLVKDRYANGDWCWD
nr:RNA-directed DNA polymerase, eukaryota, reverse transcriptase zinc-binding domain protein [Tanacetum cinerariifolium]